MKAAFFHDHRFGRDAAGNYYSNGSLPYAAFLRYLRHFDEVIVVGRLQEADSTTRTCASGPGLKMACLEMSSLSRLGVTSAMRRHVRAILARVDCGIIRLPSLVGQMACREAIRADKPWLVEVVGCAFDALRYHGSLFAKGLALPAYLATRRCVELAPFALYVTREFLQRRYPCRGVSTACPNVILETPRQEVLARRVARIAEGARSQPLMLGLVGSLNVSYKGHDTALRSIASLRLGPRPVRLLLLGGGDPARWRRRAMALGVEKSVEFCGSLPGGGQVLEWMDQLDILLVPSLTEGLPRALLEAMSRATPAIGSRVGGIPELLDVEWTHSPGDHRGLADRVRRLALDAGAMAAQAHRNWETACRFSTDFLEERRNGFLAHFAGHILRRSPSRRRATA